MSMYGVNCVEQHKIDMYIMTNQNYLPAEKLIYLKNKLRNSDDEKYSVISAVELKDPSVILLISIFLGWFGIDRFMIGDIGMGILKLLTGGCCGIMTIVDWFTISKRVKNLNYNSIMAVM